MTVDELDTIKAALKALDAHGYTDAAEALRDVLVREFAAIADVIKED